MGQLVSGRRKLYRQFAISRNCKKKIKQNIAKDEYFNLLLDFLRLFVPGEERKYC